jgi:hypothetical protein
MAKRPKSRVKASSRKTKIDYAQEKAGFTLSIFE